MFYMLIIRIKRADSTGVCWITDNRPPQLASDALKSAMEALDNGLNFEIFDAEAARKISLTELRKAAEA